MSQFWYNKETMQSIDSTYASYGQFSTMHLILLLTAALTCALIALLYKKANAENREKFLKVTAVLMVLNEAAKYTVLIATGQWNNNYLTLHLCGINIFVCLFYALKPKEIVAEFLYAVCMPGAAIALISPTWRELPFVNFMHLHSYSIHIMLVSFPIMLIAGGFKPNFRNLHKVLGILACFCVPIYFLNYLLDTNFFFLRFTENNPILEILASILGEKTFFLGFPVLLAAAWALLYLPWVISEKRALAKAN